MPHTHFPKETAMNAQPRFQAAKKALIWIGVIALALLPFPW